MAGLGSFDTFAAQITDSCPNVILGHSCFRLQITEHGRRPTKTVIVRSRNFPTGKGLTPPERGWSDQMARFCQVVVAKIAKQILKHFRWRSLPCAACLCHSIRPRLRCVGTFDGFQKALAPTRLDHRHQVLRLHQVRRGCILRRLRQSP